MRINYITSVYASHLFLVNELSEVELELLTLKNIAVNTTALARSRGDNGVQTTSTELGLQAFRELGSSAASSGLGGLLNSFSGLLTLLRSRNTVVRFKELTERSSINLNDGRLGQSVSTDKLVVTGVVNDANDTSFAGNTLSTPREVTRIKTKSTELLVTTTSADRVDTLGTDSGIGGLTAGLKLPLLADLGAHGTSVRTLVTRVSADTHLRLCGLRVPW